MIKRFLLFSIHVIFFFFLLFPQSIYGADANKLKAEVLVTLEWGGKKGEFGVEKKGKIESGYSMDFIKIKDRFYLLDSINNRIHIYGLDGEFKKFIHLDWNWETKGVPWKFTLYKNNFYMLVGNPGSFSMQSIEKIHKFSYDGRFLKAFEVSIFELPSKEELIEYTNILSTVDNGYIFIQGRYYNTATGYLLIYKVLAIDGDGNFVDTVIEEDNDRFVSLLNVSSAGNPVIHGGDTLLNNNVPKKNYMMVVDNKTRKIIRKVDADIGYPLVDKNGIFYRVYSAPAPKNKKSKKEGRRFITEIKILDSKTGEKKEIVLKDEITIVKNGKERTFRYWGGERGYWGISRIDENGNLYHLLANDKDGLVLLKITWK